jgi:hypothetical protein
VLRITYFDHQVSRLDALCIGGLKLMYSLGTKIMFWPKKKHKHDQVKLNKSLKRGSSNISKWRRFDFINFDFIFFPIQDLLES